MKISLKVVGHAGGTHRIIEKSELKMLKDGDTVEITNTDGSVDLYLVVGNAGSCSGCCMYDSNKCIRWMKPNGDKVCILAYRHKGIFNLAFKDLNQIIENI